MVYRDSLLPLQKFTIFQSLLFNHLQKGLLYGTPKFCFVYFFLKISVRKHFYVVRVQVTKQLVDFSLL